MSGAIWSKFFWADWETDPALRLCSLAAQGLWMRMLCVAASHDPIGYVAVAGKGLDETSLARLTGCQESEVASLLGELSEMGVFSRDRHGRIYSRRMIRDAKKTAIARKNGREGGNPSLRKQLENSLLDKGVVKACLKTHKPEAISHKPEAASAACKKSRETEPESRAAPDRYAEVEHACRQALGRTAPNDPVIGPMVSLIDGGRPLAGVIAVLRGEAARPRRKPIFTWGIWKQVVVERWDEYATSPTMVAIADPTDPRVDFGGGFSATLSAIQRAIDKGRWRDEWGPQIGAPGCRVPPEVAEKLTAARAA